MEPASKAARPGPMITAYTMAGSVLWGPKKVAPGGAGLYAGLITISSNISYITLYNPIQIYIYYMWGGP